MNAEYSPSTWMRDRETLILVPDCHSRWTTQKGAAHMLIDANPLNLPRFVNDC